MTTAIVVATVAFGCMILAVVIELRDRFLYSLIPGCLSLASGVLSEAALVLLIWTTQPSGLGVVFVFLFGVVGGNQIPLGIRDLRSTHSCRRAVAAALAEIDRQAADLP